MSADQEPVPDEITSLVGREVYTNSGVFVGEVEDLRLNLDKRRVTALALGEVNAELFSDRVRPGQGVFVPYRIVRAVGDVILVADVIERLPDAEDEEEATA